MQFIHTYSTGIPHAQRKSICEVQIIRFKQWRSLPKLTGLIFVNIKQRTAFIIIVRFILTTMCPRPLARLYV